jgi:DNA-directed RNA polymerase subunit alpha
LIKASGVVTAAMVDCPSGIRVLNPDLILFNTNDKTKVDMDIFVTRGRGFRNFYENREKVNSIGIIAIDSNFSPVERVAYSVEEIKTAKRGTSDKLTLEIATNGSVDPASAVALAARILTGHLEPILDLKESLRMDEVLKAKEEEERVTTLAIPIEELELTMRSYNGLKRANIQTVQELTERTRDDIIKIKNLGKKSSKEICTGSFFFGISSSVSTSSS